jgi:AbrB family looped-hinge helix DNA binding protein
MELVTVKNKFQIVIPQSIREQAHIGVGDLLEATIEDGKITFTPKVAIDRHLAEALQDVATGRTHGPYNTATEAIAALESRTQEHRPRQKE